MRSSVIVIVAAGLSMVALDANAQPRVITATETTGLPGGDTTSATDSGLPAPGAVCATANEDATACFGTAYNVPSSLINPAFQLTGRIVGVNLCDVLGTTCALDGGNSANTISDQLYLQVGAQTRDATGALVNSVLWCWDSDLEPNVNICQDQIQVPIGNLSQVLEPAFGFTDLTAFFTGPNGPLAGNGVWSVRALSEVPEPASPFLLGSVLAVCAFRLWKRKQVV